LVDSTRTATCHTPGGTGALRLAADFLRSRAGAKRIWVSDPTWANHPAIFADAGLEVAKYRYFDAADNTLDFAGMKAALGQVESGDVVLLHACCHNPSGVDPSADQWREVAQILRDRRALPLVDFAYQGFGSGLEEDAEGVRILSDALDELLICSSFSKNFGLYCERTGALTLQASSAERCAAALSQLKTCARTNYSNPPAHGGNVVTTILSDPELRARWQAELDEMRERIQTMRGAFVAGLKAAGSNRDYSFITEQKGMFSFSGLSATQVARLKTDHAIYAVSSGRINVAGMTADNVRALCEAIVQVS
jgi:aspartate/tyrosine/aromatic aminotransferase